MPSLDCDIFEYKIIYFAFGHGGSSNLIVIVEDKQNTKYAIKIIPKENLDNEIIKKNAAQLEIKFYQFFKKKFILTDKAPHFVNIYGHTKCDIKKIFNKLGLSPKNLTDEELLTQKITMKSEEMYAYDTLYRIKQKMLLEEADVLLLEFCNFELQNMMEYFFESISHNGIKIVDIFLDLLNRILFQIIFTLAVVKYNYPGFLHRDLYVRNILMSDINNYHENEYFAYYYEQRIYYLPANGLFVKINDFDRAIIVDELVPTDYLLEKFKKINPMSKKNDIFNLLHDIYDGATFATSNIIQLSKKYKLARSELLPIIAFIDRFIDTKIIDEINSINRQKLEFTNDITGIKILENSIKSPHEYLTQNYFEIFQELPKNGKIVKHYNKP